MMPASPRTQQAIYTPAGYDWNGLGDGKVHWFVRRSIDGGLTWSKVDDFTGGYRALAHALTTDSAGNVFVVGESGAWVVRKGTANPDQSMTWSSVDTVSGAAEGVFVHPTAGIFVAGNSSGGWTVRRSLDGGATWTTVDSYAGSVANGVGADAAGNLYVVGSGQQGIKKIVYTHWIVRKSSNGGSTWATVDDFQGPSNGQAFAYGFGSDSHGNLFLIGERFDAIAHH